MKSIQKLSAAVVFLIVINGFTNVFGQNESGNNRKFGIGVSLFSLNDAINSSNGGFASSIYFPINVSDQFRLEPEIALFSSKYTDFHNIGLGFFKLENSKELLLKYGARVGVMSNDMFHISPTLGAEYFLSPRFSLGAEAQLRILFVKSETAVYTTTSASFRFYF